MRCIVIFREYDLIWAKPADTYHNGDEIIYIDTSYSPGNSHNYSFRDIPIGTYFTYYKGLINGFNN
jgi:hypothetical protein